MNDDIQYIIEIILRARDEMAGALGNAREQLRGLDDEIERGNRASDDLAESHARVGRSEEKLREETDKLRREYEKLRGEWERGKRSRDDLEFGLNRIGNALSELARKSKIGSQVSYEINRVAAETKNVLRGIVEGERQAADDIFRGYKEADRREQERLKDRAFFWNSILDSIREDEERVQRDITAIHEAEAKDRTRIANEEIRATLDAQRAVQQQARAAVAARALALRGDETSRAYERFREEVRQGNVDIDTTRFVLRRFASEFGSLASSYDLGSREANRFGQSSEQARSELNDFNRTIRESSESMRGGWVGSFERGGIAAQGIGIHVRSLGSEMRGLMILGVIGFFQQLATAAIALGGNLVALASSAAMAGGALGGALAAGAAQAIPALGLLGAAFARMGAVMDALEQRQNAQQQSATQRVQQSNREADAAGRIADAQDALIGAQNRLQDSYRRVQDAQRNVGDRLRDLGEAQEDLNDTRDEAADRLDELVLAEKRAELQARGASLSVEEAQRELQAALAEGDNLRIRQARFGLDEARNARAEARDNLEDVRRDSAEARRAGVEGDPRVQEARRQVEEARRGVEDARRGVQEARRGVEEAARGVNAARRNMQEARTDATQANAQVVAAQRNLDYLLSQMSDAERGLYRSLVALRNRYDELIRPITDIIIRAFTRTVDRLTVLLGDSRILGALTALATDIAWAIDEMVERLTTDEFINAFAQFARLAGANLVPIVDILTNLAELWVDIADAAGPALAMILEMLAGFTDQWVEFIDAGISDGSLQQFFIEGVGHLEQWVALVGAVLNLFAAFIGPGGAADSGLRIITRITDGLNGWADSIRRNGTGDFFAEAEMVLGQIWRLVKEIAVALFEAFDPTSVEALVNVLVRGVLPGLQFVIEAIGFIVKGFDLIFGNPIGAFFVTATIAVLGTYRALTVLVGMFGTALRMFSQMGRGIGIMNAGMAGMIVGFRSGTGVVGSFTTSLIGAITAMKAYQTQASVTAAATTRLTAAQAANARMTGAGVVATGAGRAAPIVAGGRASAGALARGAGGMLLNAGRAAGRFALPFAAGMGIIDFLTSEGNLYDRLQGVASGLTFGLIDRPKTQQQKDDDEMSGWQKRLEDLQKKRDYPGIEKLGEHMRLLARESRAFNDEDMAKRFDEMASQADKVVDHMRPLLRFQGAIRQGLVKAEDVVDPNALAQFLSNLNRMREGGIRSIEDLRKHMKFNFDQINKGSAQDSETWQISVARNFGAGISAIRQGMADGTLSTQEGMREINRVTRQQMRFARDNMDELSTDAKVRLGRNFSAARRAVEIQAGGIEKATGDTLRRIKRLMRQELEFYGLSPDQARRVARGGVRGGQFGSLSGGGGNEGGADINYGDAGGGWIGMRGERGRDGTGGVIGGHAVGRGELLVANAAQQDVIESALYGQYGFGTEDLIRKVRGAHAGHLWGMGWAGGYAGRTPSGNRSVPIPGFPDEFIAAQVLDEALKLIRRFRLFVTDAFATSGHRGAGHLQTGTAMDVVPGPGGSWDLVDAAVSAARAAGLTVLYDGVAGHGRGHHAHIELAQGAQIAGLLGRISRRQARVRGAEGAGELGAIAQGAANFVRTGANRMLSRASGALMGEGMESGAVREGGLTQAQARGIIAQAMSLVGVPQGLRSSWMSMAIARAIQESGLDPNIQNNWDINAQRGDPSIGLFQTIGATFRSYMLGGMNNIRNPLHNAVAAFRYMLDRYGSGDWSRALANMLSRAGVGYDVGGVLPGAPGQPGLFVGHGGEWVLNEDQKATLSALSGLSLGGLKSLLGFSGGPTSFQGGGELAFQTRSRLEDIREGDYRFPAIAPLSVAGILREMRRLNRALRNVEKDADEKMNHFVNRFLKEMDALVGEGGLLAQLNEGLERRRQRRETRLTQRTFDVGSGGRIVRSLNEAQVAASQLANLVAEGSDLATARNRAAGALGQGQEVLGGIDARIARLRRGRENAAQRREIQQLLARRQDVAASNRAIQEAIAGFDQQIADNIQARFEAQLAVFQAQVEAINERATNDLARVDIGQRIATATSFTPNFAANAGAISQRGDILSRQRSDLLALADQLFIAGDRVLPYEIWQKQIPELEAAIADNTRAAIDNTRAQRQYAIDRISGRGDFLGGIAGGLSGIVTTIGAISGTLNVAEMIQITQNAARTLRETGSGLRGQLASIFGINLAGLEGQAFVDRIQSIDFDAVTARMGDEDRNQFESLINAIIQNEAAVLQNTQELQNIKGAGTAQSFASSWWEIFRIPIFDGNGALLPDTMRVPSFGGGGTMTHDGLAYLHEGGRVSNPGEGGDFHLHVTNPTEVADPDYLFSVAEFYRSRRRAT